MPVKDEEDIVDKKKRELRKKKFRKFLVFLLIIAVGFILYVTKDSWYNKLRGIGDQYRTIVNSGQLAEGNFPIEVGNGNEYQLVRSGKNIIVLSDSYTYYYDTEGNLLKKRQHTYTNSVIYTSGSKTLVYESRGSRLSVEDDKDVFYKKEFDNNILFARISPEGYTGVVTTSDSYNCEMYVYDKKGEIVYERKCIELVSDLSFMNDSSGCVISYIQAENGTLVTTVECVDFSTDNSIWKSQGINTVGLELYGYKNGAFVLGMSACGYLDENGQISSFYQYDGDMKGGSSSEGKSAVIINNDDRRRYVAVLFSDSNSQPLEIELETPAVDVTVSGGLAYVLTQQHMMAYDFNGGLRSTADVSDSYTGFVKNGRHVYLKSYKKIDRIDFES